MSHKIIPCFKNQIGLLYNMAGDFANKLMSLESLQQFRQLVMENPELQGQLQEAPDLESLVRLAVQLGEENGHDFTSEEVRQQIESTFRQQELNFPLQDIGNLSEPAAY